MDDHYLWSVIGGISLIIFLNLLLFKKFKNIIREKDQVNRRLHRLAHTDDLTGLYNYRFLANFLEKEIKKNKQIKQPVSLLMLDIDHFKNYNDKHGHPKGDKLLYEISQVIKENARGRDLVIRYGGEEFCVILEDTNLQLAGEIAERIRKAVEIHPFKHKEVQPGGRVTVSIGIAGYPEHTCSGDDLINMADQALYRAKNYRNMVETYYSGIDYVEETRKVAGLYE